MRRFLTVAFLFACYVTLAFRPAYAECAPAQAYLQQLAPIAEGYAVLDGMRLQRATAIFNARPPESDDAWSMVILVQLKDGGGAILVGRDGAVCGSVRLTPEEWSDALVRIISVDA